MKKYIYITLATIFTGLGMIGVCLPVLPTTPFLLLAIFFYMRSSLQGVKMILKNKYLSPYIKSYFSKKGIPFPIFVRTLLLLWITIGSCMIWATENLYVRILLGTVAVCVTIHLHRRRSKFVQDDLI